MRKGTILICTFFTTITILFSCHGPRIHTYYCKERDISFKIIESDSADIIVFNDSDSIFLSSANGDYLGLQFHIPEDTNIVYFEINDGYPTIYRCVEKNNKILITHFNHLYGNVDKSYFNSHFWGFYGGCDQGKYTFGIWHDSLFVRSLEPLEWK